MGIGADRLRRNDLISVRRSIYVSRGVIASEFAVLAILANEREGAFLSHVTAARLYGVPLPRDLLGQHHITRPRGLKAPLISGVIGHQAMVEPGDTRLWHGARVSSPERVMLEMACLVTPDRLVAIGDSLVRIPRPYFDEHRSKPWTTVDRIASLAEARQGVRGIQVLRRALPHVRVGADSFTETRCRLEIIRAGLPEPVLQYALDPSNPFSFTADLAFPELKIAIQYDGEDHFNAERHAHDSRRDAEFERAGWKVIRVNRVDLADGFAFLISELRRLFGIS